MILFIDEPTSPLPESVTICDRKASIYYYGQKKPYVKGDGNIFKTAQKSNGNDAKGKDANGKKVKKPSDTQRQEDQRKVVEELKEFSKNFLSNSVEILTTQTSPPVIPPSVPQEISNQDPRMARLYAVKYRHSRSRGGRTQSVNGRGEKKRLPSGELINFAKSAKLDYIDSSDSEIENSGNPSTENIDWFQNPVNGFNDNINSGV